jgi:hypothetical protein
MIWLLNPAPFPLSRQQVVSPVRGEGGRGMSGAKSDDREKALVLYKSFSTLCIPTKTHEKIIIIILQLVCTVDNRDNS